MRFLIFFYIKVYLSYWPKQQAKTYLKCTIWIRFNFLKNRRTILHTQKYQSFGSCGYGTVDLCKFLSIHVNQTALKTGPTLTPGTSHEGTTRHGQRPRILVLGLVVIMDKNSVSSLIYAKQVPLRAEPILTPGAWFKHYW